MTPTRLHSSTEPFPAHREVFGCRPEPNSPTSPLTESEASQIVNSFDRLGIIVDREENDPPDPSGARELECHLTLAAKLVERHTAVATVIVKVETEYDGLVGSEAFYPGQASSMGMSFACQIQRLITSSSRK